jgi:hypothetical protein
MNSNLDPRLHHQCVQRALALGRDADAQALPELDVYIEYWGMDTADYKIGMLKKQQLYQQQGKRLISLYPSDKARLDDVLRAKLALFGYGISSPGASER